MAASLFLTDLALLFAPPLDVLLEPSLAFISSSKTNSTFFFLVTGASSPSESIGALFFLELLFPDLKSGIVPVLELDGNPGGILFALTFSAAAGDFNISVTSALPIRSGGRSQTDVFVLGL